MGAGGSPSSAGSFASPRSRGVGGQSDPSRGKTLPCPKPLHRLLRGSGDVWAPSLNVGLFPPPCRTPQEIGLLSPRPEPAISHFAAGAVISVTGGATPPPRQLSPTENRSAPEEPGRQAAGPQPGTVPGQMEAEPQSAERRCLPPRGLPKRPATKVRLDPHPRPSSPTQAASTHNAALSSLFRACPAPPGEKQLPVPGEASPLAGPGLKAEKAHHVPAGAWRLPRTREAAVTVGHCGSGSEAAGTAQRSCRWDCASPREAP